MDGFSHLGVSAMNVGAGKAPHDQEGQACKRSTTIGIDIAKSAFQVHCIDAENKVMIRRRLKSGYFLAFFAKLPPRPVGIEGCAASHEWRAISGSEASCKTMTKRLAAWCMLLPMSCIGFGKNGAI